MAERSIQAATNSSDSDNRRQPGRPAAAIEAIDPGGIGIVCIPIRATRHPSTGDIPMIIDGPADDIDIEPSGFAYRIPRGGRRAFGPSREGHPSPIIRAIKDGCPDRLPPTPGPGEAESQA